LFSRYTLFTHACYYACIQSIRKKLLLYYTL